MTHFRNYKLNSRLTEISKRLELVPLRVLGADADVFILERRGDADYL